MTLADLMGFYPRHVVVSDAIRYGLKVLPVDLRYSQSATNAEGNAIRLGLIDVKGFGPTQIETIEVGRQRGPARSIIWANGGNYCGISLKPIGWRNDCANCLCAALMNRRSCRRWIERND